MSVDENDVQNKMLIIIILQIVEIINDQHKNNKS